MDIRKYKVIFDTMPERDDIWELELGNAVASCNRGNGTRVTVRCNGEHYALIDTRYDQTITQGFTAWCDAYMAELFNPAYGPIIKQLNDDRKLPIPGALGPKWEEKAWGYEMRRCARKDPVYRAEKTLGNIIGQLEELKEDLAKIQAEQVSWHNMRDQGAERLEETEETSLKCENTLAAPDPTSA